MIYLLIFICSTILSFFLTFLVKNFAQKRKILDYPERAPQRKIHTRPIPLLGGLAIFFSFFIILFILGLVRPSLFQAIPLKKILGIFVGSIFIMVGGYLDDKYNLKPSQQIIWPILAVLTVIAAGIGVDYVTNPFGGVIHLDKYKFFLFSFRGIPYYFTLFADIFTFVWLMTIIYATKFLDGLDGLVSGLGVIGGVIIAFLCLFTKFFQPEVALISLIFSGACLGFLFLNFHPAKIFLGEGGSVFCGFILGNLAIISGGKIATALLVLAIPILDLIWVIIRRIFKEKKAPWLADKKHLHFRLLDFGFSHRQAVLFLYLIALFFGLLTLFLKSWQKLITLLVLICLVFFLFWLINHSLKNKNKQISNKKAP